MVQGDGFYPAAIAEVYSASRSLLFSLQHFRFKHPRWLCDPKRCRDLNEVLFRTGNSKLPARFQLDLSLSTLTVS
jgi:hypothetical protein